MAENDNNEEICVCCQRQQQRQQHVADRANMFLINPHSVQSAGEKKKYQGHSCLFRSELISDQSVLLFQFLIMSQTANMAAGTEDNEDR